MPGAGGFPAGTEPAGDDLGPDAVPLGPVRPIQAVLIDPSSGQYVLESDGQFLSIHPVDQIVIHKLATTVGTMPSVSTFGQTLLTSVPVLDSKAAARIRNVITTALDELIKAGDITIVSLEVELDDTVGGSLSQLTYTNNRLPPDGNRKTLSFGMAA